MIKVAHLYYDLLNLYGEQGNILAIKNAFKNQNIDIRIDYLTINDKINFSSYDLVYLGSGSDESLMIALNDLKKYAKEPTNKAIDKSAITGLIYNGLFTVIVLTIIELITVEITKVNNNILVVIIVFIFEIIDIILFFISFMKHLNLWIIIHL